MISVQNVVKDFGNTRAVDDISFDVNEGENVVLLGTSGCGKTTTLRMINRLVEVSSGSVIVAGKNINSVSPDTLRRSIGYVLQHNGLFPHYSVAENIAIVPNLLKWPKARINKRASDLLEQLHLPQEYLSLYPLQLSGGEQQRVGLARALAADPPLLLMDEPFGALDAITRRNITKEFSQLEVLKSKTIILVTHDVKEAIEMGDRILIMDKGKIVQAGKATQLLFRPRNPFVTDFFSAQRMQLELNAVLLKDVWHYLNVKNDDKKDGVEINENKSLWDAIDALNLQRNKLLFIKRSSSGEIRYAGYDSLFSALETLKEKSHE
ncbi:MAG: ABC transporter ATP-binding protein [Ginsengibacter sp.]